MCTCLADFKQPSTWQNDNGKVLDVIIKMGTALAHDKDRRWYGVTTTEAKFTVEGRKTPIKYSIPHNFCPFCGEKYAYSSPEAAPESGH